MDVDIAYVDSVYGIDCEECGGSSTTLVVFTDGSKKPLCDSCADDFFSIENGG